jgi:phosphoribosylformylglycinamidine synthase
MWAAKLPGEGAALFDACYAMCKVMSELGIAVDGGKDSLSMAARVGGDIVKAPGMNIMMIRVYSLIFQQDICKHMHCIHIPAVNSVIYKSAY